MHECTALIWLRNHKYVAAFVYAKCLIAPFLIRFDGISSSFDLAMATPRQNTNHELANLLDIYATEAIRYKYQLLICVSFVMYTHRNLFPNLGH